MAMTNSVLSRLKSDSEAYDEAIDALRLFSAIHPEWKHPVRVIEAYVADLEGVIGLHEPSTAPGCATVASPSDPK